MSRKFILYGFANRAIGPVGLADGYCLSAIRLSLTCYPNSADHSISRIGLGIYNLPVQV